jgi:hypothetical protein
MPTSTSCGSGYCSFTAEWKDGVRALAAAKRRRFDAAREETREESATERHALGVHG